jgi:hypothetical protein
VRSTLDLAISDLRDWCHCVGLRLSTALKVSSTILTKVKPKSGTTNLELCETALFPTADVLIFMTAMPKLPEYVGIQPGGAVPDGVTMAVTACGKASGEAWTAAPRARRASICCMLYKCIRDVIKE